MMCSFNCSATACTDSTLKSSVPKNICCFGTAMWPCPSHSTLPLKGRKVWQVFARKSSMRCSRNSFSSQHDPRIASALPTRFRTSAKQPTRFVAGCRFIQASRKNPLGCQLGCNQQRDARRKFRNNVSRSPSKSGKPLRQANENGDENIEEGRSAAPRSAVPETRPQSGNAIVVHGRAYYNAEDRKSVV